MYKLTKAVALTVTLGLLCQPMVFAQSNRPVSLADVQQQAKQDVSFLKKNYGLLTASGLISAGALFSILYVIQRDKKIIAQKEENVAKLQQELDQAIKDQATLKAENKTLKKGHGVSKQRTDGLKAELREARLANAKLEKAYQKEIAVLNEKLAAENQRFTTSPINVMLRVGNKKFDMQAYRPLLLRGTSPETRTALLAKIKTEPWYKALSAQEKTFFDSELVYLMEVFRHQGIEQEMQQVAKYTVEQALLRNTRPALAPLNQLLHEVVYKGAKSVVLPLFLLGGVVAAQAATSNDAEIQQMAARLEANANVFLELNSEQLAEAEKSDLLYETCLQIGAMLHEVASSNREDLQDVRATLKNDNPLNRPSMQIHHKTAR